jgi:uncharacterized protein (TIGR02246 family)
MNTALTLLLLAAAPDVKAELTKQMEKWVQDFNAHKPAALAAHYSDDVDFLYTFDGQEGKTKKGIEGFYTQAFKVTPDITLKLVSYEVVQVSDGIAYGMGTFEDTFTGPDGKKLTVPTHASEVFVKKGGKWLVRVDHASFVPPPQPPPAPAPAKK